MESAVAAFAFPLPEAAQEVGIRLHGLRDRFTATRRKRQTSEKLARLCEYNPLPTRRIRVDVARLSDERLRLDLYARNFGREGVAGAPPLEHANVLLVQRWPARPLPPALAEVGPSSGLFSAQRSKREISGPVYLASMSCSSGVRSWHSPGPLVNAASSGLVQRTLRRGMRSTLRALL